MRSSSMSRAALRRPSWARMYSLVSFTRAWMALSVRSRSIAPVSLLVGPFVPIEPELVACVLDSLGVVETVPGKRHQEQRLAVVERLVDRVVAAVRDDHVAMRQDRRLRVPRGKVYVVGRRPVLVRVVTDTDTLSPAPPSEHLDHALNQLDVGDPQAPEAEIEQRCVVAVFSKSRNPNLSISNE